MSTPELVDSPALSGYSTPQSSFEAYTTAATTPAHSPRLNAAAVDSPAAYFALPLSLNRPEELEAVDPLDLEYDSDLKDVPVPFIVDNLHRFASVIFAKAGELEMPAKGSPIPTFMTFKHSEDSNAIPTHILAFICEETRSVQYCLTLGLLYALLSKKLAHLSASKAMSYLRSVGTTNLLPVEQIRIPEASTLHLLHHYAHHNSPEALLLMLLPSTPLVEEVVYSKAEVEYGLRLVEEVAKLERGQIFSCLDQVVRFRKLVIALEIGDVGLWWAMETAWTILTLAGRRKGSEAGRRSSVTATALGLMVSEPLGKESIQQKVSQPAIYISEEAASDRMLVDEPLEI